jgi:hypothetical protein
LSHVNVCIFIKIPMQWIFGGMFFFFCTPQKPLVNRYYGELYKNCLSVCKI